jgi:hypothetical protein
VKPQGAKADRGVLNEHSWNHRRVGPTRRGKARQQYLLFDAEMKLTLLSPEREEGGLSFTGILTAGSAQVLGDDERLMMIAREGL